MSTDDRDDYYKSKRKHGDPNKAAVAPRQASQHYDRHTAQTWSANAPKNFEEARKQRWQDRTYQLKDFHNDVKRGMINGLTRRDGSLLDLACGRGGDMHKWFDAHIKEVQGIDISIEEVSTARKRLLDLKKRRRRDDLQYKFDVRADLGTDRIQWEKQYDAVTVMFALHYFFASEDTIKNFLYNCSTGLKDNCYLFGTFPNGKHILELLKEKDAYQSPLLSVMRTWPGSFRDYSTFGAGYKFALVRTVTNDSSTSDEAGEGCEEFLIFLGALTQLAQLFHLYPDPTLTWNFETRKRRGENNFFVPGPVDGKHAAFRRFNPRYKSNDKDSPELEAISRLNVAFAFRKNENAPCSPGCLLHPDKQEDSVCKAASPREPDITDMDQGTKRFKSSDH